jgi:NAD(P)-dependent dehydrogenase (short-subunit alcohol dehydrogenase family)
MSLGMEGQRALVTGGTRGIGAAIARDLIHHGVHVTVTGRNAANFAELQTILGAKSTNADFLPVDFDNSDDVEALALELSQRPIDILINNAGINKIDLAEDIDLGDFDAIQNVNVRAPFVLARTLVKNMAERKYGRIVNISSIFGHVSRSKRLSYSTSKFALLGMTKALALDYGASGVLVNCVSPGFIDTELTRGILKPHEIEALTDTVPLKRLGRPEEIARIVSFLASPQNSFITGQNIIADGGFTSA